MITSKLTAHEHDADGEDLLGICVGTHVAKTDTSKAAKGEVERGDIGARYGGTTHGAVDVWCFQTLSQLLKPAWWERSEDGSTSLTKQSSVTKLIIFCFFLCHLPQWMTLAPFVGGTMDIGGYNVD